MFEEPLPFFPSKSAWTLLSLIAFAVGLPCSAEEVKEGTQFDFAATVQPILEEHCVRCHSPGNRKGEVSLATIDDLLESGYLTPGDAEASYLLDLVKSEAGERPSMPKEGTVLTADQVAVLEEWIEHGAEWPKEIVVRERSKADGTWWAFQPLQTDFELPAVLSPESSASDVIDAFIEQRLEETRLHRNPIADRRVLIRRATYDLTGLPPTPEEVEAFVNDSSENAFEKVVDRLLASPRYGEHWGRHWLDVVRFGESNGFERNVLINNLWPFRDYVIESINADKPFDQLIREHLAGDVLEEDRPDQAVGTAFLVAGPYDDVGNQDAVQAAQIRANTIDEMIRATSEAFLGLTIGCARCHDHKFDPILQRDYYSLYATLSGIKHGSQVVVHREAREEHDAKVQPLEAKRQELTSQRDAINHQVLERGLARLEEYEQEWDREPIDRRLTTDEFPPVETKFLRLRSLGQDNNPENRNSFAVEEFEVWNTADVPRNVALSSNGAVASGESRHIEDFPGAYGPHLAIDGELGKRFLATAGTLTIEFQKPEQIQKITFSSARNESEPGQPKFVFLSDYVIEISTDGEQWEELIDSSGRKPVNEAARNARLRRLSITPEDQQQLAQLNRELAEVNRKLREIPSLPSIFIGERDANLADGPFHLFLGGSPQRLGEVVTPASLNVLEQFVPNYELETESPEHQRRVALADWIVHPENALPQRVLVNRIWHYHFGTGIVETPSDFGYMGAEPSHPQLLDFLAGRLLASNWRIKPLHRMIMLSKTYQQSSQNQTEAARVDADARLLWRFPPRRLSAEEIRDTMLSVAGVLNLQMGGPGFRLYHFMQDNVCTYEPLDVHGPETYRRAVYHQNARASVVDLMTEFDQPDCAFSTPRRSETTTPLQALTMLNHSFTFDIANELAERLKREAGEDSQGQIRRVWQLCYARDPSPDELEECKIFAQQHGLEALCRVLLNTSALIYVE